MDDIETITGNWVEVAEMAASGQMVFLREDGKVPPSRGARRRLGLDSQGTAQHLGLGATDRVEEKGSGNWELTGTTLTLNITGWEGTYNVEKLTNEELILTMRK